MGFREFWQHIFVMTLSFRLKAALSVDIATYVLADAGRLYQLFLKVMPDFFLSFSGTKWHVEITSSKVFDIAMLASLNTIFFL